MAYELELQQEQQDLPPMEVVPAYKDVCTDSYGRHEENCHQYGVSQDMGGWFVNYTVAIYYDQVLKDNELFYEYFISNNGTVPVQEGFSSWFANDPDNQHIKHVSGEEETFLYQSCDDLHMKVVAYPSTFYNPWFVSGDAEEEGFENKFNTLCHLARNETDTDGGGINWMNFVLGGGALIGIVAMYLCVRHHCCSESSSSANTYREFTAYDAEQLRLGGAAAYAVRNKN